MADITPVYQGRTARALLGPFKTAVGSSYDFADTTVRLMVKPNATAVDADAIFDFIISFDEDGVVTSDPGRITLGGVDTEVIPPITYTLASEGVLTLKLDDSDTRLIAAGSYPYEMVVIVPDVSDVLPLQSGNLIITDTLIDDPTVLP